MVAHPNETVDGNADFATGESGVEETMAILEIQQGGFEAEEHRGVVAESGGYRLRLAEIVAEIFQYRGILFIVHSIAAEVG